MKFEYVEVYENSSEKFDIVVLSDQGQDHCTLSKVFSFESKTNYHVLYCNFCTSKEADIKHVCSSDHNIQSL